MVLRCSRKRYRNQKNSEIEIPHSEIKTFFHKFTQLTKLFKILICLHL
jgi:hypothetical protein